MSTPSDPTQTELLHILRNTGGAMMTELALLHDALTDARVSSALFVDRITMLESLITAHHQQLDALIASYEARLASGKGDASLA